MDVVIRNVDTSLPLSHIISAVNDQLGDKKAVVDIQRFKRTSGGAHKPLPLIRVTCATADYRDLLLQQGVQVNGNCCVAELPATRSDGSAALGKIATCSDNEAMAIISSSCANTFLHPEDLPPVVEGLNAYVWPKRRGRFYRGYHAVLTKRDMELIGTGAINAWPVITSIDYSHRHSHEKTSRYSCDSIILVTRETIDYHKATRAEVQRDDFVLEVGCDVGECCAIAATCCGPENVIGVDLACLSVSRAREAYPSIRFEVLDVLQAGAKSALHQLERDVDKKFSKVLIDINGNRDIGAVCRVIQIVVEDLAPVAIIVKNRALHNILLQSKQSQELIDKSVGLDDDHTN